MKSLTIAAVFLGLATNGAAALPKAELSPSGLASAWPAQNGEKNLRPSSIIGPARSWGTRADVPAQTIKVAQNTNAVVRLNALEDQVRVLNGRIEELTFQLLQMEENLRRLQEDNEFRFQEIEGQRSELGGGSDGDPLLNNNDRQIAAAQSNQSDQAGADQADAEADLLDLRDENGNPVLIDVGQLDRLDDQVVPGAPARDLGTLIFDEHGNVVDGALGRPLDLTGTMDDTHIALNLPTGDSADALYGQGYGYLQAGDYQRAEQRFETFRENYPDHPRIADAYYWLGESMFLRGRFEDAATVFLDAYKQYPDARRGPDSLLKLGLSLAGLNQRELACATYAKVESAYPGASSLVKQKLMAERKAAHCL